MLPVQSHLGRRQEMHCSLLEWLAPAIVVILAFTSSSLAMDKKTELRAALAAWNPGHFGAGSSVQGPLNIAAVERKTLEKVRNSRCPQVPFGCAHEYWEEMKRMIQPGDALVFFRTDTRSWNEEGYAIIRDGRVIRVLMTKIS